MLADVALTNYLGCVRVLHLRRTDSSRTFPSRAVRAEAPRVFFLFIYFPPRLHFCGAKRNTYMDFVIASFCRVIPLRGHCFATGRPNATGISNSNWRQFFERIFDLLYRSPLCLALVRAETSSLLSPPSPY